MRPALALTLSLTWGLGAATACSCDPRDAAGDESAASPTETYTSALARIDRKLAEAERLADARDRWPDHELVAELRMQRARLSGSIDDWLAADQAMADAFSVAPEGGGPRLTQVRLDLALHRLAAAEAGIAALEGSAVPPDGRALALVRGDLAAQRGQLDAARAAFEAAIERGAEETEVGARIALLDRRAERYDRARDTLLALAESRTGQARAWYLLQAGLVEWTRGQAAAALARYDEAAAAFPGWWLVREHRAEALAALGRTAEAEQIYRAVIEDTPNPAFMDALAELLAATGRAGEAETWVQRAEAAHARRVLLLPEAARAHGSVEPTVEPR